MGTTGGRRGTNQHQVKRRADAGPAESSSRSLAADLGLPDDWLNDEAALFLPVGGRPPGTIAIERGSVTVTVAPPDLLLAMKLRACRPGKDADDIAILLRACDVRSVDEAVELIDRVYDGEEEMPPHGPALVRRALSRVNVRLADGDDELPPVAPRPDRQTCDRWILRADARCGLAIDHPGGCEPAP
jgi:hypothetical protein